MSSDDINIVVEVLKGILNPTNEIRNAAVSKLEELRQNTPVLIYCLLKILEGIILFTFIKVNMIIILKLLLLYSLGRCWKLNQRNLSTHIGQK